MSILMLTSTIWHVAKVVSSHHGEPAKVPNVYFGAFLLFKSTLDSAQAHCRGLRRQGPLTNWRPSQGY